MNIPATSFQNQELVSALMDGELSLPETQAALRACAQDKTLLENWDTYHVIGEALRSPATLVAGADLSFHERLRARMAHESVAPALSGEQALVSDTKVVMPIRVESANDRNFRWKLVAGLASVTAVSALAWALAGVTTPTAAPQLAAVPPASEQVLVDSPRGPVLRDARLEELMAAHKQLGATSAQMPSGFLRNATFETSPTGAGR